MNFEKINFDSRLPGWKIEKTSQLEIIGDKERQNKCSSNLQNVSSSLYTKAFIEGVGVQGIRYIFMNDHTWHRRLLWVLMVLGASAYAIFMTVNNVNNFLSYPSTTKTEEFFVKKISFPAVTMCNFNVFQKKKLSPAESKMLEIMYRPFPDFGPDKINASEYDNINIRQFFHNKSYNYLTYMGVCSYRGKLCNRTKVLHTKLRDIGVCLTFDPSKDEEEKYQTLRGVDGGLEVGFMSDVKDWTHGPFMTLEGFSVLVHDPSDDVVLLENRGIYVPVGATVNLMINKLIEQRMEPPHGQCGFRELKYYPKYTQTACLVECEMDYMMENCHCVAEYALDFPSVKTCNKFQLDQCKIQHISNESANPFILQECNCPPDCNRTIYDITMTSSRVTEGTRILMAKYVPGFDILKSGIYFRVYFPYLWYRTTIQEESYSLDKLFCDIGGALGLMLGASVMSCAELLDFVLFMMSFGSVRFWQSRKRRKTKVQTLES
ncbi:acid-sensing ion channel 1-like [Styela clava]|uniref:acid-sensing ion channel 1-like n=1 Tax=Styela clava TaxID=7725 RepID=UPI001939C87B|nr:acid-sensing ion channel 1-like [Styela clava]